MLHVQHAQASADRHVHDVLHNILYLQELMQWCNRHVCDLMEGRVDKYVIPVMLRRMELRKVADRSMAGSSFLACSSAAVKGLHSNSVQVK